MIKLLTIRENMAMSTTAAMPASTASHKFNVPIEQFAARHKPSAHAAVNLGSLAGNWVNVDAATRGIVRVVLTDHQPNIGVHAYGACQPTPCDWKEVQGHVYDASVSGDAAIAFTASYGFGFKDTILTGHLEGPNLVVEDFDTFKDGSGRAPYYGKGTFKKVA
jgi:hypothetical protein